MAVDTNDRVSRSQLQSLGAAFGVTELVDPASLLRALADAGKGVLMRPTRVAALSVGMLKSSASISRSVINTALGRDSEAPFQPAADDRRFRHPAWEKNWLYHGILQWYLAATESMLEMVDDAALPADRKRKAQFAAQLLADALAPTNNAITNPQVLDRMIETGGRSLIKGARNFFNDVRHNGGYPSQVDPSPFRVGDNMAATAGEVVYRNRLIELIQYEPQTATTYEIPLLFCPPWINKYYIMDLAPGKSLIEWAVQHGHTSFAISYRNPDKTMADIEFEDYLFEGPLAAVETIREITGAATVNTASVCLGGTLTAIGMAYGAVTGHTPINTATFLNTHTDFSLPGVLGVFTDEATVATLTRKMRKRGYLEASEMAHTFDLLRANDLVFQYVVKNWLLGEDPPAFDLLAWNGDSTRMPAAMHSSYLRRCFLENQFASGEFTVGDETLDPGAITQDTFIVAAENDHIVPWQSGFKTAQLLGGRNRFVLSNAGHIAGIVNPPNPKARYRTATRIGEDASEWRGRATEHDDTWWNPWIRWLGRRAGKKTQPPAMGSDEHPALCDAPGTYVLKEDDDR
jgi:polyhydroxyalkanoate synthase